MSSEPVLRITSSIQINAPLDAVWAALTDTSTWCNWNRFVPGVTIREQPTTTDNYTETPAATTTPTIIQNETLRKNTRLTFHVNMHPSTTTSATESLQKVDNHVGLVVTECIPPSPSPPSSAASAAPSSSSNSVAESTPTPRTARITWANDPSFQGRVMASLLSAERTHELVERVEVVSTHPEGEQRRVVTEVTNWEVQGGVLAYVVKWMFGGRLEENFGIWVKDLRDFVEQAGGEGRGGSG
ncbi:uncharacterized protein BP01DRAFT_354418 [Aspergillus saccharolyticus JOP 1030-1]|uniref:Coenzyme Q-binding protein COQ10 START domain-containing protein n=1 Tax=Aspergillus saccharolyticus JOP 1030-1 TaxID=1450539 RepID=A0A318ZLW3_9EURO|nr:hypothetical protein BP01DRAFT_354418 [Aspergillus saccharolyticus JOP 1030-1]PYH47897.1 hypothetical protein BP01DRAFT_354418 [Aspergillus saccharolyticus JOP 1030-1]